MKGKIAIVHDSFFIKGGAERMNVQIAKILHADIVAATFSDASYDLDSMGFKGKKIAIHPGFRRGMLGFLLLKLAFLFRASCLRDYDTVIFSNEGISARRFAKHAFKAYYAHSISRHLFDQREQYASKVRPWFRPFFLFAAFLLRSWYISDLRAMDLILANSKKNAEFLKKLAPNVRVEVLYPPVDTDEFRPGEEQGDYYLSYARLAHAKRIDAIIRAFRLIPDKKLLVIYGKNDPQKDEFMELAAGSKNIEFRTLEDNSELPEIVRRAIAVVYVSKNEDFGMNTIEAFASGIPVIAVAEGGFLETMVDGDTGILLSPDFSDRDLAGAVESMTPERARLLGGGCLERAERFSLRSFEKRLREFLSLA